MEKFLATWISLATARKDEPVRRIKFITAPDASQFHVRSLAGNVPLCARLFPREYARVYTEVASAEFFCSGRAGIKRRRVFNYAVISIPFGRLSVRRREKVAPRESYASGGKTNFSRYPGLSLRAVSTISFSLSLRVQTSGKLRRAASSRLIRDASFFYYSSVLFFVLILTRCGDAECMECIAPNDGQDFVNRWRFAIVITGKSKRFLYSQFVPRNNNKLHHFATRAAFARLINVSPCSPRREVRCVSLYLSLVFSHLQQPIQRENTKLQIKNSSHVDYHQIGIAA